MKIRLSPSSSVDPWLPLTDAVGLEGHTGEEPEFYQCRFVPCSLISPPITTPLPTALWLTRPLAHLLFEHDELSSSSGSRFRLSPWNTLPLGHCMVFLSCFLYLSLHQLL